MRSVLLVAAILAALPAHPQAGPLTSSLARITKEFDETAFLPEQAPACGCCAGVARPPTCTGSRPSRRSLQTIGLAAGVAWGAGLGLSGQRTAEKELGPFRPIDTGLTIASAVTAVALHQRKRSCDPASGKPHGFDGWGRRVFKAKTVCGEDAADDYSYLTPPASLASPLAFIAASRDPHATRDALVFTEANALTAALTQVGKHLVTRRRPFAEFCEPTPRTNFCAADVTESFFSGHAAQSFTAAVAAGTIASMRGQKRAGWVWATGLSVATTTSLLRLRADRHHLTDVLVGIGVGTLVGWAVPHFHRTRDLEPQPGDPIQTPAPPISFSVRF